MVVAEARGKRRRSYLLGRLEPAQKEAATQEMKSPALPCHRLSSIICSHHKECYRQRRMALYIINIEPTKNAGGVSILCSLQIKLRNGSVPVTSCLLFINYLKAMCR